MIDDFDQQTIFRIAHDCGWPVIAAGQDCFATVQTQA